MLGTSICSKFVVMQVPLFNPFALFDDGFRSAKEGVGGLGIDQSSFAGLVICGLPVVEG
jgi:hypothetical protein